MTRSHPFLLAALLLASSPAAAEEDSSPRILPMLPVYADRVYAEEAALGFQENLTGKVARQVAHLRGRDLPAGTVIISGYFGGSMMLERTDTPGKFPILSRFPNQHGTDRFGSRMVINNAALGITASLGKYGFVFLQPEYSETTFAHDQDAFQLRQAYVTLTNPGRLPVSLTFGRKTIEFGDFDSFNPFTHSINTHFFWAVSDHPVIELGLSTASGFEATATAISGSRQLRVANADKPGDIANFALKAKQTLPLAGGKASLSASYLHDSIYRSNFTNHTIQCLIAGGGANCGTPPATLLAHRNGIFDVTAEFTSKRWDFQASFTRTLKDWLATNYKVQALTVQGRYKTNLFGKPLRLSGVYSTADIGPDGSQFDSTQQHVLGAEWQLTPGVWLGSELVLNKGFQPLINITTASVQDVTSWTSNTGVRVWF